MTASPDITAPPATIAVPDWLARCAEGCEAPPPSVELAWVAVGDLAVDPTYQRSISDRGARLLGRLVRRWDWARVGALVVTQEQGGDSPARWLVIDGQHRALAAAALGIEALPAVVATGEAADTAAQAQGFLGVNRDRTAVGPIDRFRAALAAGDRQAAEVAEMLADLGISWNVASTGPVPAGHLRCITRVQRLVQRHQRGVVETALDAMVRAQPDQPDWLTASIVDGCTRAVDKLLDQHADTETLVPVLADLEPETLLENARTLTRISGGATASRVAEIILTEWRAHRRRRAA